MVQQLCTLCVTTQCKRIASMTSMTSKASSSNASARIRSVVYGFIDCIHSKWIEIRRHANMHLITATSNIRGCCHHSTTHNYMSFGTIADETAVRPENDSKSAFSHNLHTRCCGPCERSRHRNVRDMNVCFGATLGPPSWVRVRFVHCSLLTN